MQKSIFAILPTYSNCYLFYPIRQKAYFLCFAAKEVGVSPNTFLNELVK